MAIGLALMSALVVGTGDFFGGFASRHADPRAVVVFSHTVGVVLALVLAPLLPGTLSATALGWGAASGVTGSLGVLSLYRGFSAGRVAVVAPVSAVLAAAVPTLVGALLGERPGTRAAVGLVVGLIAIGLVSRPQNPDAEDHRLDGGPPPTGLRFAVGAGLGFAGLFVLLDFAGDDAGLWPLVAGRLAGGTVVLVATLAAGGAVWVVGEGRRPALAAGVFSTIGNAAFLLAVQRGLLSIVAVVTSMYPASTVVLARFVLNERIGRGQVLGLALAAVAVALIASG